MKLDIIGDIHGCYKEFKDLTVQLGYDWHSGIPLRHDRQLAFIGDLTDRGPQSLKVIQTVYQLIKKNRAYYVPGNHCNKLYRYALGNPVKTTHGLETTVEELQSLNKQERKDILRKFIELYEQSPLYYLLDEGRLLLVHAGMKEEWIGKKDKKAKTFALYGDITGENHPDGSPIRRDWAQNYAGQTLIVYGHTPVREVRKINQTYNIDTGAVFGNKLTALKYPELQTVSVSSSLPFQEGKFARFD